MPSLPVLYFIRHGETDWNAQARLQGQRDVPLNDVGRAQADEVGVRLRSLVPDVERLPFLASPLGRTRETMERMRRAIGLPPPDYATDDRLKEITFGRWEGLTWKEVRARDPGGAKAREANKWGFVPPDGESYAMLAQRIAPWLKEQDTPKVVVAHGGVARVLIHLMAGEGTGTAPTVDIWQGKVLVLRDGAYSWH
jgi:broad specificity phosphatase PhoE